MLAKTDSIKESDILFSSQYLTYKVADAINGTTWGRAMGSLLIPIGENLQVIKNEVHPR